MLKIAGQPRTTVSLALIGSGCLAVFASRALLTLAVGSGIGSALILLHASLRSPNLKAKLSSAKNRLDKMGDNFIRDYGL